MHIHYFAVHKINFLRLIKSNLIEILRLFTAKEFKDFGDYLRSPVFNKNESLIKLYEYIKIYHPELDDPGLKKEKVYEVLTGKKTYNDGYMRSALFNLNKLAEDFLTNALRNPIEDEILILEVYMKRNSDKLFEKKLKQVMEILSKDLTQDQYYYYCLYRVQSLKVAYNSKHRAFLNVKDFHEEDEFKILDTLLSFYLSTALPEYRFFYNQSNVVNIDLKFDFLDEIIKYLTSSGYHKKIPLLNLYFNELMLAKEDNEQNYFNLKDIIIKNIDSYTFGVKYNATGLLANKAVNEYYRGNDKFLKERFEIHELIINKGLYKKFEESAFDDMLFKNIVIVGLQLDKIEWTESFIKDNIDKLGAEDKDNAFSLNMARLSFHKKKYIEALEHLESIKNVKHVHYKTEMKILSLMIFYEQEKYTEAIAMVDNYRHFLSNDALIPQTRKIRNSNFIKFVNELIKLKENISEGGVYDLQFDIKNTPNTYEKEWLLLKANEILQSIK